MSHRRGVEDIESWYRERFARHGAREALAWSEYLQTTRAACSATYAAAEPLAWRRLRRRLAELQQDRRRDAFERDRMLAELVAYRLAS